MKISIIIVTYNRFEQLRLGIESLFVQSLLPDEIILIDDGSKDDTRKVCADLAEIARNKRITFRYFYLNHPEPRISCIPKNVGIKKAEGDLLIFTESECLQDKDAIKKLVTHLREKPSEIPLATQVWSCGEKFYKEIILKSDNPTLEKLIKHPYAMLVKGNVQNTNAPDSDWAMTGSMNCFVGALFGCYKKDAIAIGGFDEIFTGHGWDDWDFLHRLALYGKKTVHLNDLPVLHMWHDKSFYPYNIIDAGKRNGKISEMNIKAGKYRVNGGRWGEI